MSINYKKSYTELKNWILNLRPYCYTCLHNDSDEEVFCDECNRKSIGWECSESSLPELIEED